MLDAYAASSDVEEDGKRSDLRDFYEVERQPPPLPRSPSLPFTILPHLLLPKASSSLDPSPVFLLKGLH